MISKLKNKHLLRLCAFFLILQIGQLLTACGGGDGSAAPTVTISNATVIEGDSATTMLIFNLAFSSPTGNASFNFSTSDGTATLGDGDFIQSSGLVNIPPGVTNTTLSVVIYGDTTFEPDETFTMTLSNLVGITATGSTLIATGTITNEDAANPVGYYTGGATINVMAGNLTINSPDLQAIVDTDKFVIVSVTDDILYKGTFTSVTDTSYTADLRVYRNGDFLGLATVSGTYNFRSSMDGTISGTGDYLSGSFNLTYDTINSRTPLTFIINDQWGDVSPLVNSGYVLTIESNTMANFTVFGFSPLTDLVTCQAENTVLNSVATEQPGRVRSFTTAGLTFCTTGASNGRIFDGLFTTFDESATDNRILFVSSDDTNAIVTKLLAP